MLNRDDKGNLMPPRKFRKLHVVLTAFLLATGMAFTPPSAGAESGIALRDTAGHWALPYIEWAIDQGLAKGYDDGTFKPQNLVTESEFLAMLLRSYQLVSSRDETGASWSTAYYNYGQDLGWPLSYNNKRGGFKRGDAAKLLASALNGKPFGESEAVQWLLDESISQGRSAPTVSGFEPRGNLTRAEALTFLYNVKEHSSSLSKKAIPQTRDSELLGISIGDGGGKPAVLLGQPQRVLESEYNFSWHVYNSDYGQFAMFGILDDTVAALFTNAPDAWSDIVKLGQPLGNLNLPSNAAKSKREDTYYEFQRNNKITTVFLDTQDRNKMIGVFQVDGSLDPKSAKALGAKEQAAMETLLFDLTNAERASRGLPALEWDKLAAAASRAHSADMAARQYFNHTNPDGASPFDRMKSKGITYGLASENIAAGFGNSLFAHYSLLNSKTGHRESILDQKLTKLGTGVSFGGPYRIYYTQNFYTPL
ncbi:CAP domain-containing protein [Paenibacillus sp. CAU 1782]